MEAARHWAIGGADPQRRAALQDALAMLASLREWHAGPEHTGPVEREIARLADAGCCEVHADNWDALMLFCELGTQWRFAPGLAPVRTGIDRAALEATLRLRRVPPAKRPALLDDLVLMELEALAAWREQREVQAAVH